MSLLTVHRAVVQPDWTDYNKHLSDGYYLVIFSHGTTGLMTHIGMGPEEREATHHTLFTVEVHINYLHEIKVGTPVRVDTQILGRDSKRLHIFHTLHRGDEAEPAATTEQMMLNTDITGPKVVPFRPDVLARIDAIMKRQSGMPRPKNVGRVIGLPVKTN